MTTTQSEPIVTDKGIAWTSKTWNPMTGCSKISPACKNCYAKTLADRMKLHPNAKVADRYRHGFAPTLQADKLGEPYKWRGSHWVFVNSMSDIFHEAFSLAYIQAVFDVMNRTPQHNYQVLTKRSERMLELSKHLTWSDNIWMGVSVEDQKRQYRIEHLRQMPTENRFLSIEPLLEPLPFLDLTGIGWVIVGGESGKGHRPIKESWVTPIRDYCLRESIPFFFKQWGGKTPKSKGKELQGQQWCEMPA